MAYPRRCKHKIKSVFSLLIRFFCTASSRTSNDESFSGTTMWMLKGGICEPPLGHYSTATQFRPTTDAPENVNLNDSKSMRNENETYMATVTDALESIMTNYDKRIHPGYGGMKEIVHLRKMLGEGK